MSYRQEAFIEDAVLSALAQDLEPLEIFISDDCSSDETFELIERCVSTYSGPHQVKINRNPQRLGSVDHLAKMAEVIGDAFIITAHGDDVAQPHRARALVEAWRREGVSMVSSAVRWIGAQASARKESKPSRRISADEILEWVPEMLGATLAFHSEIITGFERLSSDTLSAGLDSVLPLRAEALNGLYYVAEELVGYRRHDRNMGQLTCDRTRSTGIFEEGASAHVLAIRDVQRRDLQHLMQGRKVAARHRDLLAALDRFIKDDLAEWVRRRAALRKQNLVSTWCDEAELIARRRTREVAL